MVFIPAPKLYVSILTIRRLDLDMRSKLSIANVKCQLERQTIEALAVAHQC